MPKHDITVDSAEMPVTLKLVILTFFQKPKKGLSHDYAFNVEKWMFMPLYHKVA